LLNLNQSGNGQAVNRVTVLRRLPVNDDVCGSDGNQPKRKHRTFRFMILAIPGALMSGGFAARAEREIYVADQSIKSPSMKHPCKLVAVE